MPCDVVVRSLRDFLNDRTLPQMTLYLSTRRISNVSKKVKDDVIEASLLHHDSLSPAAAFEPVSDSNEHLVRNK